MTARCASDGPSCRVVTRFRESNSVEGFVTVRRPTTVRPAMSSRSSESCSQYPNFQNLSVLERDLLDGPSWNPSTQTVITRNKLYCSKRLNRSLHYYLNICQNSIVLVHSFLKFYLIGFLNQILKHFVSVTTC